MRCLFSIVFVFLQACAPAGKVSVDYFELLESSSYTTSNRAVERGLFAVNVTIDDRESVLVIDTGATQSAIFDGFFTPQEIQNRKTGRQANIFGLSRSGLRPVVNVQSLTAGGHTHEEMSLVVLSGREDDLPYDGVLGMDILKDFHLHYNPDTTNISFLPADKKTIAIPTNWKRIELRKNPFSDYDRNLHFMDIRISGKLLPAILDTGSEYSLIGWEALDIPQIDLARRRLYDKWIIEGAVGEFEPLYKVDVQNMRAGQKIWKRTEFLLMDFDHLNILGAKDKAVAISGANLLRDDEFFINFEDNSLWIAPTKDIRGGTVVPSGSKVRN